MEILSYRWEEGGELVEERLADHIKVALEVVDSIERTRAGNYAAKLGFPDFKNAVRLSIILHDSGKIFYQLRRKQMSFRGHEYYSTLISDYFFRELIRLEIEKAEEYGLMRNICNFAIFFHHHAMNVRSRVPIISEEAIELGVSLLQNFVHEVKPQMGERETKALETAADIISERKSAINHSTEEYVNEVRKEVWRGMVSDSKVKKLCYLTLTTLMVADNISAQQNRKSKRTRFYSVMEEFRRLYM